MFEPDEKPIRTPASDRAAEEPPPRKPRRSAPRRATDALVEEWFRRALLQPRRWLRGAVQPHPRGERGSEGLLGRVHPPVNAREDSDHAVSIRIGQRVRPRQLWRRQRSAQVRRAAGRLVDFSFNLKELYGQSQFPLVVARGQGKIEGKAKFANLNGAMLNDIFFGRRTRREDPDVIGEAATIPTTPFQVTVANGATFKEDLGVTYAATGVPLTRVPSAPATGQYSVSTRRACTRSPRPTSAWRMLFDYAYTARDPATPRRSTTCSPGTAPTFGISLPMKYNGKSMYLRLNAALVEAHARHEDRGLPGAEFDFKAFADAANVIGTLSMTE
jgi:hypothetical protein